MNILYLYDSTQTYTATIFEHISSFYKYSRHNVSFIHNDQHNELAVDFSFFDAVVIHYSIRLPFDQIAEQTAALLSEYKGLKALLIQDEYDHTQRVWHWIKRIGIQLVFTVVPRNAIPDIYPPQEFPATRFVSVLTGYVPEDLPLDLCTPPSQRHLTIGYRGRPLPIRYGVLGQEKINIGKLVKHYCEPQGIAHDIEWTEEARIYGLKWYEFVSSCRAMLGSESGSNVFDWDGTLATKIKEFRTSNPHATDDDVYTALILPLEVPGLMNQISPRIFEAIASRTLLVLFEGTYSGVVTSCVHFIPLKKDGSNLDEVFRSLADDSYVDAMAERAYQDIIASGRYSYRLFVGMVDDEIERSLGALEQQTRNVPLSGSAAAYLNQPISQITTSPIRVAPPQPSGVFIYLWLQLPKGMRIFLKPRLKYFFGKG